MARPYLSTFHQALGFALQFQPLILMGLGPGQRGDLLHEVKDAFWLPTFFPKHGLNNLALSNSKTLLGPKISVKSKSNGIQPCLAKAAATAW